MVKADDDDDSLVWLVVCDCIIMYSPYWRPTGNGFVAAAAGAAATAAADSRINRCLGSYLQNVQQFIYSLIPLMSDGIKLLREPGGGRSRAKNKKKEYAERTLSTLICACDGRRRLWRQRQGPTVVVSVMLGRGALFGM